MDLPIPVVCVVGTPAGLAAVGGSIVSFNTLLIDGRRFKLVFASLIPRALEERCFSLEGRLQGTSNYFLIQVFEEKSC